MAQSRTCTCASPCPGLDEDRLGAVIVVWPLWEADDSEHRGQALILSLICCIVWPESGKHRSVVVIPHAVFFSFDEAHPGITDCPDEMQSLLESESRPVSASAIAVTQT